MREGNVQREVRFIFVFFYLGFSDEFENYMFVKLGKKKGVKGKKQKKRERKEREEEE